MYSIYLSKGNHKTNHSRSLSRTSVKAKMLRLNSHLLNSRRRGKKRVKGTAWR
jgi:hypothetical protein